MASFRLAHSRVIFLYHILYSLSSAGTGHPSQLPKKCLQDHIPALYHIRTNYILFQAASLLSKVGWVGRWGDKKQV